MINQYNNLFTKEQINYLSNLPEVLNAKEKIDKLSSGSIYFNIKLSDDINKIINEKLGLNLYNNVPMRWIKGDTKPHVDVCQKHFDNTYLIYLVDSIGELVINNNSYPITEGTAYKFPENLNHETINTGNEPRLLLGPMSEEGLTVGTTGIFAPGGTTVYIKEESGNKEYSIDNTNWNLIDFPCFVNNTDTNSGYLIINFITDINIDNTLGYFICNSEKIQFGSTSLKNDGSRPIININCDNYDGFILNGIEGLMGNGYNNIRIFNLNINVIGGSCQVGAGWLCKSFFANGANNNYIVNCSSNGNLPGGAFGSGCLVGFYAACNVGSLRIIGCSSSGSMGQLDGGIVGAFAGNNEGSVICQQCYTTGVIGNFAGGIFGDKAANNNGFTTAIKCYTTGIIGSNAGGIYGRYAGGDGGEAIANKCYSLGNIGADGGGIYGLGAGTDGTTTGTSSAVNSYSNGTITTGGTGIYGSGKAISAIATNCYIANGSWNTITANASLTGTPTETIGDTWVSTTINQPYELNDMGYSPYSINNIITTGVPTFNQNFNTTVEKGNNSSNAIVNGKNYTILSVNNASITIDNNTGAINTTNNTPLDVYTIYIRNTGSYNITIVTLTVTNPGPGPVPCLTEDTTVLTPNGYINVDDLKIDDYVITSCNKKVKIVDIYKTIAYAQNAKYNYPCIIPQNSISHNYPPEEFRISQDHLIKYKENWIRPKDFFNLDTSCDIIKYYHIKLQNYNRDHLVINNGIVVESLAHNSIQYKTRLRTKVNKISSNKLTRYINSKLTIVHKN